MEYKDDMVYRDWFLPPLELWEKGEAELNLLSEMLRREENRLAGAKTCTQEQVRNMARALLHED